MEKEALYDLIDRHLRGELTPEEDQQLVNRLQTDTDFAREVNLHREIKEAVADPATIRFRQSVREAETSYLNERGASVPAKTIFPLYLKIAAAILLLASAITVYLLIPHTNTKDPLVLFSSNFVPYAAPVNFRSETSPYSDEAWIEGLQLYNNGNFAEAINSFNQEIANHADNKLALLLRGVSYLAQGNAEAAEKDFVQLRQEQNVLFGEQATWYLALAYLKLNKVSESRQLLKELASGKSKEKAEKLLRELE